MGELLPFRQDGHNDGALNVKRSCGSRPINAKKWKNFLLSSSPVSVKLAGFLRSSPAPYLTAGGPSQSQAAKLSRAVLRRFASSP
jgi:hypothetical protein